MSLGPIFVIIYFQSDSDKKNGRYSQLKERVVIAEKYLINTVMQIYKKEMSN